MRKETKKGLKQGALIGAGVGAVQLLVARKKIASAFTSKGKQLVRQGIKASTARKIVRGSSAAGTSAFVGARAVQGAIVGGAIAAGSATRKNRRKTLRRIV